MGNDLSRRNSDQMSSDVCMPRRMNNQHPLKFHSVHGEHVTLSKNYTVARRSEGFCKGIVFSQRPVAANERIYIKFLDISSTWSGALRIGFTANDPTTFRNKLPKYVCPYMTDVNGNWARALAERLVKEDSILFYYLNSEGEVHYGFDNEDRGILFSGVSISRKLWALLDIYGNTVEIEFLNPPNLSRELRTEQSNVLDSRSNVRNLTIPSESNAISVLELSNEFTELFHPVIPSVCFHEKHGNNVILHSNRKIYECSYGNNSYAFLNRTLKLEEVLVMHIMDMDSSRGSLIYGVTSCDPSKIHDLPDDPEDLVDRPEYWVFQRSEKSFSSSDALIFFIRKDGALMFRKNLAPFSVTAFVDQTLPLWFFIDLCNSNTKISITGTFEGVIADEVISHAITKSQKCSSSINSSSSIPEVNNSDLSTSESHDQCIICLEAPTNCALYRCGHACLCFKCAEQLWHSENPQCPICREDIDDILKIYK